MQIDVVNAKNEKVGALELNDQVFASRVNTDLIWSAVVQENASQRRGTHATKNRALVSGSGKKPWRQKGTGRARVGEIRNPLWRKGGTVFGPQPRSYAYELPKKARRGALAAALAQKISDGAVIVVDRLESSDRKTKSTAEMLKRLGAATGKTLVIDVKPDDGFSLSARNIAGVKLVATNRVTARDVVDTTRVVATKDALEKLQEALG
ncbi:MAG TPA: 50S ribosomal protein L4 [Vicinamibacterales bacterium]|nr:50S ribosomal protein L4 [Vicinamibacterales bacterium]